MNLSVYRIFYKRDKNDILNIWGIIWLDNSYRIIFGKPKYSISLARISKSESLSRCRIKLDNGYKETDFETIEKNFNIQSMIEQHLIIEKLKNE